MPLRKIRGSRSRVEDERATEGRVSRGENSTQKERLALEGVIFERLTTSMIQLNMNDHIMNR